LRLCKSSIAIPSHPPTACPLNVLPFSLLAHYPLLISVQGAHAWALLRVAWRAYKRIFLFNSSVRGPFIPPYAGNMHWTE
jgi:hypothetical protein